MKNSLNNLKQNQSTNKINLTTRKENNSAVNKLSSIVGVKPTAYKMRAKVLNSNNEDVTQQVLAGESFISAGYKELKQNNKEENIFKLWIIKLAVIRNNKIF